MSLQESLLKSRGVPQSGKGADPDYLPRCQKRLIFTFPSFAEDLSPADRHLAFNLQSNLSRWPASSSAANHRNWTRFETQFCHPGAAAEDKVALDDQQIAGCCM